ncbi:MAG: hypothetical protein Q8S00_25935 [Deltaproteobacteria bacterium]|nr:hypothetical protein [Deltaproteobacteria bacterium]MDZ4347708.1 hypothetical protein [Candidatus Binatia bacterium]
MTGKGILFIALIGALTIPAPAVHGQLFESDSKRFGGSKMDIVVREIERRDRSSVIEIKIKTLGSSVGSSFFLLCSLRQLAIERGGYRYIVKIEEHPKRGQMLVGFLRNSDEGPASLDKEFSALTSKDAVIDLDQFAEICGKMK